MTTAFVFITVMAIAQSIHMLFTVHHLLFVLRARKNEKKRGLDKMWMVTAPNDPTREKVLCAF